LADRCLVRSSVVHGDLDPIPRAGDPAALDRREIDPDSRSSRLWIDQRYATDLHVSSDISSEKTGDVDLSISPLIGKRPPDDAIHQLMQLIIRCRQAARRIYQQRVYIHILARLGRLIISAFALDHHQPPTHHPNSQGDIYKSQSTNFGSKQLHDARGLRIQVQRHQQPSKPGTLDRLRLAPASLPFIRICRLLSCILYQPTVPALYDFSLRFG
jgi:hypothetical protein